VATVVADFDPVGQTLHLAHRKGKPFTLRPQHEDLELVCTQAHGRPAQVLLFPTPAGHAWTHKTWGHAFRAAAATASVTRRLPLPEGTSTYDLRHARISESLQIHHIDSITGAQQCGISVWIIQNHYFRFIQSALQAQLGAQ
jgi:hypothetical protein